MAELSLTNLSAVPPLPPLLAPAPTSELTQRSFDDHLQRAGKNDEPARKPTEAKSKSSPTKTDDTKSPSPRDTDSATTNKAQNPPAQDAPREKDRPATDDVQPKPAEAANDKDPVKDDSTDEELQAAEIAAAAAIVSQVVAESTTAKTTVTEKAGPQAVAAEDATKTAGLADAATVEAVATSGAAPVSAPDPTPQTSAKKTDTKQKVNAPEKLPVAPVTQEATPEEAIVATEQANAAVAATCADQPKAAETDADTTRPVRKTKGDKGIDISDLAPDSTSLTPTQTAAAIQAAANLSPDDQDATDDTGARAKSDGPEKIGDVKPAAEGKPTAGPNANAPARLAGANSASGAEKNAAGSPLSDVDRVRFVQRVARAFQSADENGGEIRLRLSPPSLGSIKLEIQMQDGNLSAKLHAETESARNLLLDNLPMLRERLAEQNIRVTRFDVELMDRSAGGLPDASPGNSQGDDQHGGHGRRSGGRQVDPDAAVTSAPRRVVNRDGGQLNIVI